MGTIFDAFKKCEEEGRPFGVHQNLYKQDWYALLQYDRQTGLLDLSNPDIIKGGGTVARLLALGMIDADGRLTSQGVRACEKFLEALADADGAVCLPGRKRANGDSVKEKKTVKGKLIPVGQKAGKPAGTPKNIKPAPKLRENHRKEFKVVEETDSTCKDCPELPAQAFEEISSRTETHTARDSKTSKSTPKPNKNSGDTALRAGAGGPLHGNGEGEGVVTDLVVLRQPYSPEAEMFKALRSTILFPGSGKAPRVILVTSTQPEEGKSFVAANLAASIALHLDRHVLLVDCDLRKPSLHRLFGLRDAPGLSEHLEGNMGLASLLQKTTLPRLSLLSAGKSPFNPAELLTSEKMFSFLEEVKNRYEDRLIVMDSPPLMAAAESNVLGRFAEGILLVVREGGPKRDDVLEAVQKIDKRKILGLVGNFTSKRSSGYYYNSKKYTGY